MTPNARWQFVLVYTMPGGAKERAVEDVSGAVDAGALRVGEEAGLPLHHYPLEQLAEAHGAVQDGAVGKVLVDVADGEENGPAARLTRPAPNLGRWLSSVPMSIPLIR